MVPQPSISKNTTLELATSSVEYITLKEMLDDLVDLLAGNAPVISRLSYHFSLSGLIIRDDDDVKVAPYNRAKRMFLLVLAMIKTHDNPNTVFSSLITSLQKVGLTAITAKLMDTLSKFIINDSYYNNYVAKNGGDTQVILQPLQREQVQLEALPHQSKQLQVKLHSLPTIQLSSKKEVARNIEFLCTQFLALFEKIKMHFNELIFSGKLIVNDLALQVEEELGQGLNLSEVNLHSIFNAIQHHCNFLNFILLKRIVCHFVPTSDQLHTELIQYINCVDKFSESSQVKHIQSTFKEMLSPLPISPTTTTSGCSKPLTIKLNERWEEMTLKKLRTVLKHYFGVASDIFTFISFDYGSFIMRMSVPSALLHSIHEIVNEKIVINSMNRIGILEVVVNEDIISIKREDDDNNFDSLLHQSIKAGNSFEVSTLLQLGADPNSKDEREKSAIEIARESGHAQIEALLISGTEVNSQSNKTKDEITKEKIIKS